MATRMVVPETKPATEWVRGRWLQKVSPKTTHSRQQKRWLYALDAWAEGRGMVGPEWRFWVGVRGEAERPLTPDVAYVAYVRLDALDPADREDPPLAPDVVVEVRSPSDRQADVEWKIAAYLRAGSALVIVDDPERAVILAYDAEHDVERGPQIFEAGATFVHLALPGMALDVAGHFAPEARRARD